MTMYVAVGQSSGASRTMFLSPSSGQPSFLPMEEVRLGTGSAHSARSFLGRFQGQG